MDLLRRIWKWGITLRVGALTVLCSLGLPWCSGITGTDLLRTGGLERFWLFPAVAVILILLPFLPYRRIRIGLESLLATALLSAALYVGNRFRALRGIGVDVAVGGALLALLGALSGLFVSEATSPDSSDQDTDI